MLVCWGMFAVELAFYGDLPRFLRQPLRATSKVLRKLDGKTAVKDVIEACGIPHPEVDLIVLLDKDGTAFRALDFSFPVDAPMGLAVYPVPAPEDLLPTAARLQARHCERFVADCHLGALARHLRLLGLDTAYEHDAVDGRLLEVMVSENRALLTRDRRLLMHSIVRQGYCPRSDDPEEQAREVLRRFVGSDRPAGLAPMSRCLRCNGMLREVPKQQILSVLAHEPKTLRYYDEFLRCEDCGRIYWRGSHFKKLAERLARIR